MLMCKPVLVASIIPWLQVSIVKSGHQHKLHRRGRLGMALPARGPMNGWPRQASFRNLFIASPQYQMCCSCLLTLPYRPLVQRFVHLFQQQCIDGKQLVTTALYTDLEGPTFSDFVTERKLSSCVAGATLFLTTRALLCLRVVTLPTHADPRWLGLAVGWRGHVSMPLAM